ncbi:hypothetical protein JCM10449v2_006671 [Rhodotorula kratochvilovae]
MSTMQKKQDSTHPDRFRCAVFPSAGAPLELQDVEYRPPGKGKVALKTEACFPSRNDAVAALGLRSPAKFPVTPGQAVLGRIVEVGSGAREGGGSMIASVMGRLSLGGDKDKDSNGGDLHHKFKPGEMVIASVTHQGLGEYCTGHATSTCALFKDMPVFEQTVTAVFGGRVLAVYERYKADHERKTTEQLVAASSKCQMHAEGGSGCNGCIVVYGSGGYASLAYHMLWNEAQGERVVLVSPSQKHSHQDYGVPANDFLQCGKDNVDDALRKLGGVKLAICVDQPNTGFGELLDAACAGAEVSVITISGNGTLDIPVGDLLSRSLSVRGPPVLTAQTMHRALRLCEKHSLHRHIAVRKHAFDVDGVRACWEHTLRSDEDFYANAVVFEEGKTVAT